MLHFTSLLQVLFQIVLISTGNLSFLNWLTILPSIWFFDDKVLSKLFSSTTLNEIKTILAEKESQQNSSSHFEIIAKHSRTMVSLIIGGILAYLSYPIVQNLMSSRQIMNTSFEPFRIVNTYGAFGHVTKERTEIGTSS